MEEIVGGYERALRLKEDKERITKIIEKIQSPTDLIFLDLTNNDIDKKIVQAIDNKNDFLKNIKKQKV